MLICCPAPPDTSVIVVGVEDREKSAGGLEFPLQDVITRQRRKAEHALNDFEPVATQPPADQQELASA